MKGMQSQKRKAPEHVAHAAIRGLVEMWGGVEVHACRCRAGHCELGTWAYCERRHSGGRFLLGLAGLHAQDVPSNVGAEVFAQDHATGGALNQGAVLGRDAVASPRLHGLVPLDTQPLSCSDRAAQQSNRSGDW
jgi:hypothetical protein